MTAPYVSDGSRAGGEPLEIELSGPRGGGARGPAGAV